MNIFTKDGIDYVYILDVVEKTGCSVQSLRYLTSHGNVVRKMTYIRDRGRILIPMKELTGYPFVRRGSALGNREIFHYNMETGEKFLCKECSYGTSCEARKEADALCLTNMQEEQ